MTDWDRNLSLAGSESRAGVLVQALDAAPSKEAKADLLREWFNMCDALAPWRDRLRSHFAEVGFVTDAEGEKPRCPVTVYRAGWEDDKPEEGLSWTTSRAVAEKFAHILTSPRAMFLGISREGVVPYIWQATCWKAYAYFNGREEQEIVPATLTDIQAISMLVTVPNTEGDAP